MAAVLCAVRSSAGPGVAEQDSRADGLPDGHLQSRAEVQIDVVGPMHITHKGAGGGLCESWSVFTPQPDH